MTRPRVLFATHSPAISGAEYVLLNMTKDWAGAEAFLFEDGPLGSALSAQGLKVHVSRFASGFSSFKRDKSLLRAFPLVTKLVRTVFELASRARKVDCVYANSQKAFTLAAAARPFYRRPLIWHLHDILEPAHFGRKQLKMQVTLANRFADLVIVPSTAAADAFVAQGGHAALVTVVANGTDPAPQTDYSKVDLAAELGIGDVPLIGVFSRLAAWKGQHVVIEALQHLPDVNAIIVGDALFGEDAYRQEVEALVTNMNLANRVHFLGQRSDVRQLMKAVDVVVHPSTSPEPFGLTLIEAMSVNTPIVATKIGASAEILEDGKAGLLVAPGDPKATAEAVSSLLEGKVDLEAMSTVAHARFEAHYTSQQMRDAVDQAVTRVCSHG